MGRITGQMPPTRIPSEADIAWAAGFFDGEGCIMGKRLPGDRAILMVSASQNDMRPLAFLQECFGGTIRRVRPQHNVWAVYSKKARHFLVAVLPYLRVKDQRARLALELDPVGLSFLPNRGVATAFQEAHALLAGIP